MVRARSLVLVCAAALSSTALATAASARSPMAARYHGAVRSVSVSKHSFTLKLSHKSVRIYTTEMTHYHGISSFMAIHKGLHLVVKATERASDHTWWATSVSSKM